MNIQTVLSGTTPYNETSYMDLAKVVENSYTELSFFGNRDVHAVGYTGSVRLEYMAQRVADLVTDHPEFSQTERKLGYSIENKIYKLYEVTLDQEYTVNFITAFFRGLRNFFSSDSIHDKILKFSLFDRCTLKQYREVTGREPNPNNRSGSFLNRKDKNLLIWDLPKDEMKMFEYPIRSKNTQ